MLLINDDILYFPYQLCDNSRKSNKALSTTQVTMLMVGLDVIATIVGIMFGQLMNIFRKPMKYFAIFFLLSYVCFITSKGSIEFLIIGCILSGIANGIGVPYLNTIASIKGGSNSATTVMPLLSASLYLGQFISPIIVTPIAQTIFGKNDIFVFYRIGVIICIIFIYQVWSTRHFQSLPPQEKNRIKQ